MYTILYPCYPYDLKKHVDPDYEAEYSVAQSLGFDCVLLSHDDLTHDKKVKLSGTPKNEKVIYRGWMLLGYEYAILFDHLHQKNFYLINDSLTYAGCHYFPRLYEIIKEDTTECISYTNYNPDNYNNLNEDEYRLIYEEFRTKLNCDCILKDFVKSEKGTDLFIVNNDMNFEYFVRHIKRFIEARGELFNVGIVLKKVRELKKYGETTNEWRAFYLNKTLIHLENHIKLNDSIAYNILTTGVGYYNMPPISLVEKYIDKINSNFYTLDFAEDANGDWFILEGGDGQVSGLTPNTDINDFYKRIIENFKD